MGLLDNLSIMLGTKVTQAVNSQLFDWIRAVSAQLDGVAPALSQASFFIDPVNGSDNATGLTSTTALRTFSEYRRRVGNGPLLANQTVTILSSLATTDLFDLSALSTGGFTLLVQGTLTTTLAGQAASAYTPRVAATNTPNQLTSTAATVWTPFIGAGQFIQMTSGASNGNLSTVCLDLTANAARVGTFINLQQVETQPAALDTYQIVTVPTVTLSQLNSLDGGITISRLRFVTNQVRAVGNGMWLGASNAIIPTVSVVFDHCCFDVGPQFEGSFVWIGCQFMAATVPNVAGFAARQQMNLVGCCFFDTTAAKYNFFGGSLMQFSSGTIFQGTGITIQRGHYIFGNVSFFDTVSTSISAIRNAYATFTTIYGNTGAGNPFALTLDRSSNVGLVGATQTLTNAGTNEIAMPLTASTTWAAARAAVGVKDGATSDASIMVTT